MQLSVPSISMNMLGGIMNVPMTMYGYTMDKLMTINGTFKCDDEEVYSRLLMLPDVESMRDFTAPNAVIFRTASRTPVSANLYTLFMSAPCATGNMICTIAASLITLS